MQSITKSLLKKTKDEIEPVRRLNVHKRFEMEKKRSDMNNSNNLIKHWLRRHFHYFALWWYAL